jgi:N-acetylmuramoyl-L-alanine amidase
MPVQIGADDRIVGAKSVDLGTGNTMEPTKIVIHNSAGSTLKSAVDTLKERGFSYNVLVDVDGSFHQARPFTRSSSHAGRSNWKAQSGLKNGSSLNSTAIGISIINLGGFAIFSGGKWFWGGTANNPQGPSVKDEDANKAALVYQPNRPIHWTPYKDIQLTNCKALIKVLLAKYPTITEIVGHHDIAIDGKIDPGAVCPLEDWRAEFGMQGDLGLESEVDSPDGEVNLRDRPGTGGAIIGTLKNGKKLHVRSVTYAGSSSGLVDGGGNRALTGWASVDTNRSNTHAGFVYMKYLSKTPLHKDYEKKL